VCGIAGLITTQDMAWNTAQLTNMMAAIRHRGPDGDGQFFATAAAGQSVGLGHLRLAIVDLATGDQPMHSVDQRYSVVFNGEIYNYVEIRAELEAAGYRFRTQSDTEVLLTAYIAWQEECLKRFRGMFAFAIWDAAEDVLFLARDPFGKKPLLYFQNGPNLVFGSEFAALAAHPDFDATIKPDAVAQYLVYKYVPGSGTLLSNVQQLPPGHFATWQHGEFKTTRYYRPPLQEAESVRRPMTQDTVSAFTNILSDAVRIRMRSDVPLGAFLSGGIDSSAIVALMARESSQPVKTFSIGFHEEEYSELWAARLIAKEFKTDHHELKISPDDFLDKIEEITWLRGAPLSEMADVPLYYLAKLASEHVKVVLSGEGSDELLAGYPKHWGELWARRYQSLAPAALDPLLIDVPRKLLPYGQRRLSVAMRAARERDFLERQAAWFGLMPAHEAAGIAPGLFSQTQAFVWDDDPGTDFPPLHRALLFDKMVWLPGTLLERGDRMTMAASIEGRMPFMDTELAKFVTTLPDAAFLSGRTGKSILRTAMQGMLPAEILTRPKVGFRVPIHEWLRGRLRDYVNEMLLGPHSRILTYCDKTALANLIDEHQSQRRNREKELWSILTLEIFLRQLSERHHVT
jgi:asparagine synthase (glutamine-hydrolysing)